MKTVASISVIARGGFLFAVFALVLFSVLLPAEWIGVLRHRWWWFTYPLDRIESMQSAVNLVHAILFLLLGIATHMALPSWRVGRVLLAILLLGVATELVQVLVPGRHPRWTEVLVDVGAGVLGWAAMQGVVRWARAKRASRA